MAGICMAKKRTRISVDQLVAFLDVNQVALLCDFAGGRRIPRPEQFKAWERRVRDPARLAARRLRGP